MINKGAPRTFGVGSEAASPQASRARVLTPHVDPLPVAALPLRAEAGGTSARPLRGEGRTAARRGLVLGRRRLHWWRWQRCGYRRRRRVRRDGRRRPRRGGLPRAWVLCELRGRGLVWSHPGRARRLGAQLLPAAEPTAREQEEGQTEGRKDRARRGGVDHRSPKSTRRPDRSRGSLEAWPGLRFQRHHRDRISPARTGADVTFATLPPARQAAINAVRTDAGIVVTLAEHYATPRIVVPAAPPLAARLSASRPRFVPGGSFRVTINGRS